VRESGGNDESSREKKTEKGKREAKVYPSSLLARKGDEVRKAIDPISLPNFCVFSYLTKMPLLFSKIIYIHI